MKKRFDQIDHLCRHSHIRNICYALGIAWIEYPGKNITVQLPSKYRASATSHILPGESNLRWRRVWRAFLTDHVDDLRPIAGEDSAAGRGELPCAAV